jgi:hypothetical protein
MHYSPMELANQGVHAMGDKSKKEKDKGEKQKVVKDEKDALEKQSKQDGASANEEHNPTSE